MKHDNESEGLRVIENNLPLISVGIPTYDRHKGLRRTLECITSQTYANLEIIISDNASPNPNVEMVAREFMEYDQRVHYHRQTRNEGALFNFEFVLNKSSGEYFMWAADDDELLPDYIQECLTPLITNSEFGFAITKWSVESDFSPIFNLGEMPDFEFIRNPDRKVRVFEYSRLPFHTHKDNLVHALWRTKFLQIVLLGMKNSPMGKAHIGASMNEYALTLRPGYYSKRCLLKKRYKKLPPGHALGKVANIASKLYRSLGSKETRNGPSYNESSHISDLRTILEYASLDEQFIDNVIIANEYHLKFGKAQSR